MKKQILKLSPTGNSLSTRNSLQERVAQPLPKQYRNLRSKLHQSIPRRDRAISTEAVGVGKLPQNINQVQIQTRRPQLKKATRSFFQVIRRAAKRSVVVQR